MIRGTRIVLGDLALIPFSTLGERADSTHGGNLSAAIAEAAEVEDLERLTPFFPEVRILTL
jgi:hypothetical protein